MSVKVVTAGQMRAVEEEAFRLGVPASALMDRAGRSVAEVVAQLARRQPEPSVLVLVGPGNNGGDGLVVARYLVEWGIPAQCYIWHRRGAGDRVREQAAAAGVPLATAEEDPERNSLRVALQRAKIVVDALLGTGLSRGLSDELREILTVTRSTPGRRLVVAIDVPSGLESDSGRVDEATLTADITVSLGHLKAGLIVAPGAEYAGRVVLGEIGLPEGAKTDGLADVLDDATVAALLPRRRPYSHKGTHGKALVVAGSANYVGAAMLSCQAAARAGAGLVTLAVARSVHPIVAGRMTEVTYFPLPDEDGGLAAAGVDDLLSAGVGYDAWLVGPGLGRRQGTVDLIRSVVRAAATQNGLAQTRLVLDADALNALAGSAEWWRGLGDRAAITPHAGEMARLLGTGIAEVESNRLEVARRTARELGLVVVLKGAYTVVAAPDGRTAVSPIATPALATAGSGDVLAGIMVGLQAQGLSTWDAARAAVLVHGRAGERLEDTVGQVGAVAGDLPPVLPDIVNALIRLDAGGT